VERLCLYEWATAGGLDGPDGSAIATEQTLADAVREEGGAMLTALAREAASSLRYDTRVLLGEGVVFQPPAGVNVVTIPRGREQDGLQAAAAACDWLLLVAPETDRILERRLQRVAASGCQLASPTADFVALAADKHATAMTLAAAGVPVPAGCRLRIGECPPAGFRLPLVRKRLGSTGCDGLQVIRNRGDAGKPAMHDERLEAFVHGLPVSVSVLCGSGCLLPLPPVVQRFSPGCSPSYLGGQLPVPTAAASRAQKLAVKAIRALTRAAERAGNGHASASGWVGVDMILGDCKDGHSDRVLEINPRVTTSFVGLVQCSRVNLIDAMLTAASGGVPNLDFKELPEERPFEFLARPSLPSILAAPT
jgi:predicted ATP-grasp superfamily ATP-dependent carboligase